MSSILVVEGEGEVARLLKESLGKEGYQTVTALNGEDAVQCALHEIPSLIILDILLPGGDGYHVLQQLREHPKSMHIPVIMLGGYGTISDEIRAYDLGVDSFITKPYSTAELLAHVRRHIRRIQQSALSPLTRLPGGLQLERAIDYKLNSMEPWSILYLDLDNFKAFNDVYGFLAGNDMILLVGHICQQVVYEYGNIDDFVGHVGGDDFVIVTTPDREKILCRYIQTRYKEESALLYRQDDLERGTISGVDRKGRPYQFPLVSLSIGVVSDQLSDSHDAAEVGTLTAEAKRLAKQSSTNLCCISPRWNSTTTEYLSSTHPASSYQFAP